MFLQEATSVVYLILITEIVASMFVRHAGKKLTELQMSIRSEYMGGNDMFGHNFYASLLLRFVLIICGPAFSLGIFVGWLIWG
ncbi:hypothetical protein SAMN04487969_102446 [Paenibacillus algorifonticola]|uniref:Uncharacterized protein n=1 Tax=Paenibacillus algorifonticola TaxID=684063 RepID=A0A1I2AE52_9BACL|nr:hypothetical protein SAMN04487969_102446 [Paenibacillus algorifonticola]